MPRRTQYVLALLSLGLALRLAFAIFTPAWDAADEYPHYWVAEHIAEHGELPQSSPDFPFYEAYQPPLHYVVLAGFVRLLPEPLPYPAGTDFPGGSLLLLRLVSVLFGFMTLVVVWHTLRDVDALTDRERWSGLMVVAALPTFVGVTAAVNNDALVALLGALVIREVLRPRFGVREGLLGGLWAGLGLLTKLNAAIVLPLLFVRVWSFGERDGRWRTLGSVLLGVSMGGALLLARNLALYGDVLALTPGLEQEASVSLAQALWALRNMFWSFWLAFGQYYEVHWPAWTYVVSFGALIGLGVLGWVRGDRSGLFRLLTLIVVGVGAGIVASLYFTLTYPTGTQTSWGKNLYPVLPLIALFLGVGWSRLGGRYGTAVVLGAGALMLVGCGWGLWALAA